MTSPSDALRRFAQGISVPSPPTWNDSRRGRPKSDGSRGDSRPTLALGEGNRCHKIAAVPFTCESGWCRTAAGITGSSSLLSEREQRRGTRKLRRNTEGAPAAELPSVPLPAAPRLIGHSRNAFRGLTPPGYKIPPLRGVPRTNKGPCLHVPFGFQESYQCRTGRVWPVAWRTNGHSSRVRSRNCRSSRGRVLK